MTNKNNRISTRTKEGYDKNSWIKEADRHFNSATILRNSKKRRRSRIRMLKNGQASKQITLMESATHSSILLLAYSVELYLKAGLTCLYIGCSQKLFDKEVRSIYGHNLVKIAEAISYPIDDPENEERLIYLKDVILSEGRYPFQSANLNDHIESTNKRAVKFWSEDEFAKIRELSISICNYIKRIDSDSKCPAHYQSFGIDSDGYFAFRCGGNLNPSITVKYSSQQKSQGEDNEASTKILVLKSINSPTLQRNWDSSNFRSVEY